MCKTSRAKAAQGTAAYHSAAYRAAAFHSTAYRAAAFHSTAYLAAFYLRHPRRAVAATATTLYQANPAQTA